MGSRQVRQYYCPCGTHLAKDNTERQCARCQRDSRDKLIAPPDVPAEFWQTEQFREAFAAQHMGRVARAYRTHPSQESAVIRGTGSLRVGLDDVMRLRAVRRQIKALDDAHGGGTAFPMAVTYLRREVLPLLQGHYDEFTGRALFTATAELKLDVGWMAYDAGNYALAWRYMVQALRLSHAVDNRLFGGRVLAAMSHQALHLRAVPLAVDLARAAREGTKCIAPPKAQAMLAAMEACTQAAYQRARPSMMALIDAEKALARVGSDDDPDWLDFDQGGLSGHAARALRDLRRAREAEHHAATSLKLCQHGHSRTRAQRNAILATTQLQLGDVEAAAATGLLIVTDAWQLHSIHVYSELAALVRALEPSDSTAAKDFLEQARGLLAARSRTTPGS